MFGFAQQEERSSSSFRHDFEYEPPPEGLWRITSGYLLGDSAYYLGEFMERQNTSKTSCESPMILHNLLVDAIGGDTVVGRYSINPVQDDNARFDDVDHTNDDAKLLRDTMKDYFCFRNCIR
ncbi:hypothetical protein Q1695_002689 [Nippostrongylus brasiliensis]|nr:hypothetical protein Q1695_002689 [Nippostrongylus brasiliensis]